MTPAQMFAPRYGRTGYIEAHENSWHMSSAGRGRTISTTAVQCGQTCYTGELLWKGEKEKPYHREVP